MNKANIDIRKAINNANLRYWEVAKEYGLTDSNFTRLLRFELSEDKRAKIMKIIEDIKGKKQNV